MHLVLVRQLRQRLLPSHRLQDHLRLELSRESPSLPRHQIRLLFRIESTLTARPVFGEYYTPAEYRPGAWWIWWGNRLDVPELIRELDAIADAGYGGVNIQMNALRDWWQPAGEPVESPYFDWTSDEWFGVLEQVVARAQERGAGQPPRHLPPGEDELVGAPARPLAQPGAEREQAEHERAHDREVDPVQVTGLVSIGRSGGSGGGHRPTRSKGSISQLRATGQRSSSEASSARATHHVSGSPAGGLSIAAVMT